MTPQKIEMVITGGITFVERSQNDYEELYDMYNVSASDLSQNKPPFCVVHEVHSSEIATEENINKIDKEGDSYLIPAKYNGIIIWELK